jgi:hypothetical protein
MKNSDELIKIGIVGLLIGVAIYLASKGIASVETAFASINISPLWLIAIVPIVLVGGAFLLG